jgi:AcrR family transcriptional regulator
MPTSPGLGSERRRRPKDRKEQIARVSADAFSELGYHGVSMEGIAGRVGVTAASLYRHYAGKYELFRAAVLALGSQLEQCTAFIDEDPDTADADPRRTWDRLVEQLIDTTLKNRTSGGLYRWEGRYLHDDDQLILNGQIKLVNRRLQRPLLRLRPELRSRQRWTLSSSVLSVIGSVTDHRAELSDSQIHTTFARIARDIRDTDLPDEEPTAAGQKSTGAGAAAGEYEQILHEALLLFYERGYRDTGMEDIATEVNMPTSSIYKYFSGKSAILAAIYRRSADRVSGDASEILAASDDSVDAVHRFVDAFVRRSFANPELAYVYYVERGNVPAPDRVAIHNIQRATIEAWVRQVAAARPAITDGEARFAVHAAFSLVVDLSRLMRYEQAEASRAVVGHLLLTTLLGRCT